MGNDAQNLQTDSECTHSRGNSSVGCGVAVLSSEIGNRLQHNIRGRDA